MYEEVKTHKGVNYTVAVDDAPSNPLDFDNLGTIVMFHRRESYGNISFGAGQEQDMIDYEASIERLTAKHKAVMLTVYAYSHGNIVFTADFNTYMRWPDHRWDAGQIGFIYAENDRIREWFGVKRVTKAMRVKAYAILRSEIEQYSNYVSGDTYMFKIEGDENDCWYDGYTYSEVIDNAEAMIDEMLDNKTLAVVA